MRRSILSVFLVFAIAGIGSVLVSAAVYQFSSPEQEARFNRLIAELRCLVCQNQSLADSNAELASDLREEVYNMVKTGEDDGKIIDFLVARYGDFVLYRPPVKGSTYLLWFGPFVFLAIAAFFLMRFVRSRAKQPESDLSETERARLDAILNSSDPKTPRSEQ